MAAIDRRRPTREYNRVSTLPIVILSFSGVLLIHSSYLPHTDVKYSNASTYLVIYSQRIELLYKFSTLIPLNYLRLQHDNPRLSATQYQNTAMINDIAPAGSQIRFE